MTEKTKTKNQVVVKNNNSINNTEKINNIYNIEKINNFKVEIMKNYKKELDNFFKKDEKELLKFMSGIVYAINKIPSLLNDREWLIHAVLELAQIGLTPWIWQEAYILPYKKKSTAQIWYQGYVKLLYETGISSIHAEIVYSKDIFKNILWINPTIVHEVDPTKSKKERWEPIWAYVVVKIRWENIFKYMNKDDILVFRDKYSQSYKSADSRAYSPWEEANDPELNMWKKTVLKQLIKMLPKTSRIELASELDNKEAPFDAPREVETWSFEERQKAENFLEKITAEKLWEQ